MKGINAVLRRLTAVTTTRAAATSSSSGKNIILSSAATYSTLILAEDECKTLFVSPASAGGAINFRSAVQNNYRSFSSSSSSSDPSNIVAIESKQQFNDSLSKVQDESLPAIFYFTAAWCGPCRLLSPIIGQLSEKYPHVTTYKIDIDKEELGNELSKLNIHSVPTLHFFQDGKKASEVIGADVQRLKDTMEELYK